MINLRLPSARSPKQGGLADVLGQQKIFLERGYPLIEEELLEAVLALGGG